MTGAEIFTERDEGRHEDQQTSLSWEADAVRTQDFHRDRHGDIGKQAPLDALALNPFA
ncbi:hypothetical protein [Micromonospora chersina]|uniref:hypothetical protein n=1 Tax=Micromonospora chersina TaxID=47854 RepID=UPI00371A5507